LACVLQFEANFRKAVQEAQKEVELSSNETKYRQFYPGGGNNGNLFQGGGGNYANGNYLNYQGNQEFEESEEEYSSTTPRVHPLAVLGGVAGIFNGLAQLSPTKVFESTVNFFPTDEKFQATNVVNNILGRPTITTTVATTPFVLRAVNATTTAKPTTTTATTTTEAEEDYEEYDYDGDQNGPSFNRRRQWIQSWLVS